MAEISTGAQSPLLGLNSKGDSGIDNDQAATFRSFFQTYNVMSAACFERCVWDFGTADLRRRESVCVDRCTQHYLQVTKEIGKSFADGSESLLLGTASRNPAQELH